MVVDTHECPAPGCEARVPFERFACRQHWFALPKAMQRRIWRAYRDGSLAEHVDAMEEARAWLESHA
jgi:hypothetical protein